MLYVFEDAEIIEFYIVWKLMSYFYFIIIKCFNWEMSECILLYQWKVLEIFQVKKYRKVIDEVYDKEF